MSTVERRTKETNIVLSVDSAGDTRIATSLPFLDHMLVTLARYSGLAISVNAEGDLRHHIVEDVAISLGIALRELARARCARYGSAIVPMDDALVQCALDVGGRPYYRGPLPSSLYDHFMRSLATSGGITLHLRVLRGDDRHHVVEAAFKALGLALRAALQESDAVFSTKGAVALEVR